MKTTRPMINVQPLRTKDEIGEMKMALKRVNKGTLKKSERAEQDVLLFLIRN